MQIGELGFEQVMKVGVAGDVAGAAAAGAERAYGLHHCIEHDRVLPHPEIVVRAPYRYLAPDAVIERAGKKAATALEMGESAVASFGAKLIETLFEEAFVIHLVASFLPSMFIAQKPHTFPDTTSWLTSFGLFVVHGPATPFRHWRSQRTSHSGLLEPRGTSTVLNEPGVRDRTTWSVIP